MSELVEIPGTPYCLDEYPDDLLAETDRRVKEMRSHGELGPVALERLRRYFRIKNIYTSNAIEGNSLNIGETRQVVELGLTITGKSLKDQAEATNLASALDLLEILVQDPSTPIREGDVRSIHALILKGINDAEAGHYRTSVVEISGSNYKPPGPESVSPQMEEFGRWLAHISVPSVDNDVSPLVLASAAHTWFVTIHPFIDGNGRTARLILNLILMRYGYPIAIIGKEDRLRYYDALELSQSSDLSGVVSLVAECIQESLEEYERAVQEQVDDDEWARSIAGRFTQPERIRVGNEYEVWKSAMDLLKSYFRQTVDTLNQVDGAHFGRVYFTDFGTLEFEKYASLRHGQSAKRTWFFRIDFRSGTKTARYLFFFGSPSQMLKDRSDVTVFLSREERPFNFVRLDQLGAPNVPDLREVGYVPSEERFVARFASGPIRLERIEVIGRQFIEQVVQMHFGG